MIKPPLFDKWNPSMRGAYTKGYKAQQSGESINNCPYIDKRKDCGRLTWSRAYIRAWEDGFRDSERYMTTTLSPA